MEETPINHQAEAATAPDPQSDADRRPAVLGPLFLVAPAVYPPAGAGLGLLALVELAVSLQPDPDLPAHVAPAVLHLAAGPGPLLADVASHLR